MTPGVEEYLEAIFHLQIGDRKVSTKKLADYLKVAPPSVTDMIKKLSQKKLVKYMPYHGVILTNKGRKEAIDLIRKHRLSEVMLSDLLGIPWDEVHDEACRFEHVISENVEKRMVAVLGNPKTCPHGNPIPKKNGSSKTQELKVNEIILHNLPVNTKAIVSRVIGEGNELLKYLSEIGIVPGKEIEITKEAPFKGPFIIKVNRANYPLSREISRQIVVEKL